MRYCRGRGGFTLLEVTVSMVSASFLVAAMGTALSLAVRSTQTSTPADAAGDAYFAATSMMNDLQTSKGFTEMSPTSVSITTTDRDGDGLDEMIRYSWSGIAGRAVMRRINAGTTTTFVPSVNSFALEYKTSGSSIWAVKITIQPTASAASKIEMLVPLLNGPATSGR